MFRDLHRRFAPQTRAATLTLQGQLSFMAIAYGMSALLFWAVSGQVLVAVLTLSSQVGGPALVALMGSMLRRDEWTRPAVDFEPRRVATWAFLTGAVLAAAALAVNHLRSI